VVARGFQTRAARRGAPVRRVAGLLAAGGGLLALLTGCSVNEAFSFGWPERGISDRSPEMFNLWIGSTIAALVVGVFVWGLIFWCVVRYRKRGDQLPPQTRFNLPIEILYTVAPFLVIAVLFYYTAVVQTNVNRISPNPDLTVNVVSFKWNWKFEYPDAKTPAGEAVYTIGDSGYVPILVVPTNKRILFTEHSNDVIHSFWVPELLFKRDVFPGDVVNKFELTIEREGRYVGRCAELCGTYHSMMNFEVRAVSPDRYEQFITAKKQGKSTPQALLAAGFSADDLYATTTRPFDTHREQRDSGGKQ
jgi:cytochrome c oxidase subunit II